ncbi:DUF4113 domain-containing protein, partial [Methylobacterium radiotolerans]|uniref:DUF4113 domain-containing protein n=1 Tax=Methylobacterium radiotolerans TaxID=31998 RepID=UPI0015F58413
HLPQLGDDILRLVPLRSHLSVLILARKPYLRADHFIGGRSVPARAGLVNRRDWNTKFEMRTPRYTTRVNELPIAYV